MRFALLALLVLLAPVAGQSAERHPWIIDTDMGADDWMAIISMARNPQVEIKAVTASGNGLAHCFDAAVNALHILKLVNLANVPVACGSDRPTLGLNAYPAAWRADADAVKGLASMLPAEIPDPSPLDSPSLLVQTLRASPGKMSILAIGAHTNIAAALEAAPDIADKIERIVVMAGAINVPGNIQVPCATENIPNKVSEWNMFIDPLAARKVFRSGVAMTLVPLDATDQSPVYQEFVTRLGHKAGTPWSVFLLNVYYKLLSAFEPGQYFNWDPLAAGVAVHPELCQYQDMAVDVVADRDASGHLVIETAGRTVVRDGVSLKSVCMKVNSAAYEEYFIADVTRP